MHHEFNLALKIVWGAVLIYWVWSAFKIKSFSKREGWVIRFVSYWLPLVAAFYLLGPGDWFGHTWLREQFVPHSYIIETLGLLFCIAGAGLAIWSRYLLGKNWSLAVQLKDEHELVESGPYSIVRHPIYSALLVIFFGNALLVGDWRGLIAVAILFVSFFYKAKKEELWLTEHFGEKYEKYKEHTYMIIPKLL